MTHLAAATVLRGKKGVGGIDRGTVTHLAAATVLASEEDTTVKKGDCCRLSSPPPPIVAGMAVEELGCQILRPPEIRA